MHIIGLIIFILKTFLFILNEKLFCYITIQNIIFMITLVIINCVLIQVLKHKYVYSNLTEQIMSYRFQNANDFYYSFSLFVGVVAGYISLVFYFRIIRLSNPVNLNIIYTNFIIFYNRTNIFICVYNLVIILLVIQLLILFFKIMRKRFNVHLVKLHFFFLSFLSYKKVHNFFRDKLSIKQRVVFPLNKLMSKIEVLCCFGYLKNTITMYDDDINPQDKKNHWSEFEIKQYDCFSKKHEKKLKLLLNGGTNILYSLHFIIFILFFLYDLIYNNGILKHVALILPWLFFYQLYLFICKFIEDKITYNICELTNMFYYQDVKIIDHQTISIKGVLSENPNNFVEDFLEYEAVDFYYTIYMRRKYQ